MRLESVRRFREGISRHTKEGEVVIITNHGKMVGCFLPLQKTGDVPIELKKEVITSLGRQIVRSLSIQNAKEEEILDDFQAFKKNRRR